MRLQLVLAAATILSSFGAARADTFNLFNLSAILENGTATGTVTLDQTTGKFTASNIKYVYSTSSGSSSYIFTGAGVDNGSGSGYNSSLFTSTTDSEVTFQLALPLQSLINYKGGQLCTAGMQCATYDSSVQYMSKDAYDVTSGTLTLPVAVTPEPSALVLLGTGVLATGSLVRRRYV